MLFRRSCSVFFFAFLAAIVFSAGAAFASCSNPVGTAGDQIYSSNYNVMQYCNGAAWVNMGTPNGIGPLTPGDFCTTDGTLINCNTAAINMATQVTGTLGVGNGGTGTTTFTANLPLLGNGTSALAQGTISGNTTKFATVGSGTLTSGDCVKFDASGNIIDAGAACSSGGGTPGGSNQQIQFNNSGAFGGANSFIWNTTSGFVGLGTTTASAQFHIAGGATSPAWTTNGIRVREDAATYIDNSSSGTVASNYVDVIGQPTLSASSTTTYTNAATMYIAGAPASGTNVTITNPAALVVGSGNVGIGTTSPQSTLQIGSGQLLLPESSVGTPSLADTSGTNSGIYFSGGYMYFGGGGSGTAFVGNGIFGMNVAQVNQNGTFRWSSATNYTSGAGDTGLSRLSADKVAIGNGTNGDYSGTLIASNVGIGTTSPGYQLDIQGGSSQNQLALETNSASSYAVERWISPSHIYQAALGGSSSAFADTWYLYDQTNGNTRLTVNSSGNVGIGTGSANEPLEIVGASGSYPLFITSADGWSAGQSVGIAFGDTTGGSSLMVPYSSNGLWSTYYGIAFKTLGADTVLTVGTGGTEDVGIGGNINTSTLSGASMVVKGTGDVGIGTTGPSTLLHVNGASTFGLAGTTAGTLAIANTNASGTVTVQNPSASSAYNFNLPATAGTAAYLLTSQAGGSSAMTWTSPTVTVNGTGCTLGSTCTITAVASSLTVGTSTISSGTSNGLLYDNGGTLGNLATANGGVLVTSNAGVPSISATPTLGVPGASTGQVKLAGATSGTVTVQPQAAAGTYNFNLPTAAGSSGQPLLSGGGGAAAMTFGTLGVGGGGTGATTFSANAPLIGNGASAIATGTVSGNTTKFVSTAGTLTSGDCVKIDASGNMIDAGAACGISGGTANYVPLWTSASAQSISTIYQSGSSIGIGTTNPQSKLQVNGEIQPGSSGASCTSANAGAIRVSSSSNFADMCTGTNWYPIMLNTAYASGTVVQIAIPSGSGTWTVPTNWNSLNNTIEAIGGGGGGYRSGGGGGAYAKSANVVLVPGGTAYYSIGSNGTDTWLNTVNSEPAASSSFSNGVMAAGGTSSAGGATTQLGGQSSNCAYNSVAYSGGSGSAYGGSSNGGGGGAAGPNGAGGNGTNASLGGNGDNGSGGTGGNSNVGNPGSEWYIGGIYYGAGGGGGGNGWTGCSGCYGFQGGNYGAGTGGAWNHSQVGVGGLLIITYTVP
jgi:hypothetical protein